MPCDGSCAAIAGAATTFSIMGCVLLCVICVIVVRCLEIEEEDRRRRLVRNPISTAMAMATAITIVVKQPVDEDPIAVEIQRGGRAPPPSQTQQEPEPTEC